MGVDRRCERPQSGGALRALVVPAVSSFAVDKGFRYAVTDQPVTVGSLVRVPLSGRRVRGYVVALEDGDTEGLKPILKVSSPVPLFDAGMLSLIRWTASHYVAPLSVVLARAASPNLPKPIAETVYTSTFAYEGRHADIVRSVASERRFPPVFLAGQASETAELIAATASTGRSVLVVVPTAIEAEQLASHVSTMVSDRVVLAAGDMSDARLTTAWSKAASRPGSILIGTERVALWPVADLGLLVIVDEGRRAHKARQTPTVHSRDVLRARARVQGVGLVMTGLVPTTEAYAAGVEMRPPVHRPWSPIEMVDRTEEPPGAGLLLERTRVAIAAAAKRDQRVFVLVGRKGYAPAFRCVGCRQLRRCEACGAATNEANRCQRCGASLGPCRECGRRSFEPLGAGIGSTIDQLRRLVDSVGRVDSNATVMVGTERDLTGLEAIDLGVVVDADGLVFGTNYRSAEDALRLFARLASLVSSSSGARTMIQTAQVTDSVFAALRRADAAEFLEGEVVERQQLGFPPYGELIVVEVADGPSWMAERMAALPGTIMGPAPVGDRVRWLIQGAELTDTRVALRKVAAHLRDGGAKVRIDVDPIDL